MQLKSTWIDASQVQAVLTFLGPVNTLLEVQGPSYLHLELLPNQFTLTTQPTHNELPHDLIVNGREGIGYQNYRSTLLQMLSEQIATQAAAGALPIEDIKGSSIMFQAIRHHGMDFEATIAKMRAAREFNPWKRADDHLGELGTLGDAVLVVHNRGLQMNLHELRLGDLAIERINNGPLSIKVALPQTIGHSIIGRPLREVVSHPMLDPIDIIVTDYDSQRLFIADEIVSAAGTSSITPACQQALTKFAAWEKTWDSGKDMPPWQ